MQGRERETNYAGSSSRASITFRLDIVAELEEATGLKVLRDEPEFSEAFMSYLLARNARVEADLVDQLFNSSEKRLARVLLLMANFGKEGKPEPVIAKISQEPATTPSGFFRM